MAHFTPIRDAANRIIGLAPAGQEQTGFASLLQETMTATGAAPAPPSPAAEPSSAPGFGRTQLAVIVAGLVVALILVVLVSWAGGARPAPATPAASPAHAMAPAATPEPPTAMPTPTAEPTATTAPTATPEPPTQTPAVIYVEVAPPCDPANPPYVVEQEVRDDRGIPLGTVVGTSCESQDAARANAAVLADDMKGK